MKDLWSGVTFKLAPAGLNSDVAVHRYSTLLRLVVLWGGNILALIVSVLWQILTLSFRAAITLGIYDVMTPNAGKISTSPGKETIQLTLMVFVLSPISNLTQRVKTIIIRIRVCHKSHEWHKCHPIPLLCANDHLYMAAATNTLNNDETSRAQRHWDGPQRAGVVLNDPIVFVKPSQWNLSNCQFHCLDIPSPTPDHRIYNMLCVTTPPTNNKSQQQS